MARRGTITRAISAVLLVAAAILLVKLAWFPAAQEPGYVFERARGGPGEAPGELREPIGIAVHGSEVFVSDAGNHRLGVFDLDGRFLREISIDPEGLARPMHIEVTPERLFVPEYMSDRVLLLDHGGREVRAFGAGGTGPGELDAPAGVAVDVERGRIYVADFYNHRVQALALLDGSFLFQLGTTAEQGQGQGEFNYPTDVAVGPTGILFVADAYNNRIQAFDADGAFLSKWGGPGAGGEVGSAQGWFHTATAVAVGPQGNVFVADFLNHRIQKFSPEGKFLATLGRRGTGPGELELPTDVALDAEGNLYVVDFGNARIQKFAPAP